MMNIWLWCQTTLISLGWLLGSFIGFGFLFQWVSTLNAQLLYRTFGRGGVILTGFLGTTIHEGSHALMCLVFGHRIKEIKWFRPISSQWDGRLGYVSHTWDSKNLYHNIGNFFIGIAPMIGGTLMMMVLFRWLLPDAYQVFKQSLQVDLYVQRLTSGQVIPCVSQFFKDVGIFFKSIVSNSYFWSWRGLVFVFSLYSIASHMGLSGADLKGSLSGLCFIVALTFILTIIMSVLGFKVSTYAPLLLSYNIRVSLFLVFGLMCSVLTLFISWIFSLFLA